MTEAENMAAATAVHHYAKLWAYRALDPYNEKGEVHRHIQTLSPKDLDILYRRGVLELTVSCGRHRLWRGHPAHAPTDDVLRNKEEVRSVSLRPGPFDRTPSLGDPPRAEVRDRIERLRDAAEQRIGAVQRVLREDIYFVLRESDSAHAPIGTVHVDHIEHGKESPRHRTAYPYYHEDPSLVANVMEKWGLAHGDHCLVVNIKVNRHDARIPGEHRPFTPQEELSGE